MRDMTEAQVEAHNARVRAGRQGAPPPAVPCPPPALKPRPRAAHGSALSLTVAVPPTTNLAYVHVKETGKRVLGKAGRKFKKDAKKTIQGEALAQRWRYDGSARLSLSLYLHFPTGQRRDISNCVKLLEDALSESLGFDDKAVDVLHVERKENDKENPRCEVRLEVLC